MVSAGLAASSGDRTVNVGFVHHLSGSAAQPKAIVLGGHACHRDEPAIDFIPGVGSYAVGITRARQACVTSSETQDRHAKSMDGFLGD